MGNSASAANGKVPKGKHVVEAKITSAFKTGVLNLADQKLKLSSSVWNKLSDAAMVIKLRTLDISGNSLKALPVEVYGLVNIKTLIAVRCSLQSTHNMDSLVAVTNLKLDHNDLEIDTVGTLPPATTQLSVVGNHLTALPLTAISSVTSSLAKLDLGSNRLESLQGIEVLVVLSELYLDDNFLEELPEAMGALKRLRKLSLERNRIRREARSRPGQQSIPRTILVDTDLDNLQLAGNPGLQRAEVLAFEGIDSLLQRRQAVKAKAHAGNAQLDGALFGLA